MADDLAARLHSTTDAMVWAEEFCRLFDGWVVVPDGDGNHDQVLTIGTMLGWFANAIETGRSAAHIDGSGVRAQDSPRWCEKCQQYGDHHSDRCTQSDGGDGNG